VLATYGPLYGLGKDQARIARGFGSGIGRLSQTCGAVTGAAMVIGLKVPGADQPTKADIPAKEETYATIQEFAKKFQAANGSLACSELLGVNLGTPEGRKQFGEKSLLKSHCAKFVQSASVILEDVLHLS
jgi:C_GCAxxG_C_C family probable redox protein